VFAGPLHENVSAIVKKSKNNRIIKVRLQKRAR